MLVTGSRTWHKVDKMRQELKIAYKYLHVIENACDVELWHGDCPDGADAIADLIWSLQFGKDTIRKFPADWSIGRSAGFKRNKEMVDAGPDIVLAFQVDGSKGTQHTIDLATKAGIEVVLFKDYLIPPF